MFISNENEKKKLKEKYGLKKAVKNMKNYLKIVLLIFLNN